MRLLGKILQIVGLILLPLACLAQLTDGLGRSYGLSQMVLWSAFGVAAFMLGRYLEGYAAS